MLFAYLQIQLSSTIKVECSTTQEYFATRKHLERIIYISRQKEKIWDGQRYF